MAMLFVLGAFSLPDIVEAGGLASVHISDSGIESE